jgi:hypothetical protein
MSPPSVLPFISVPALSTYAVLAELGSSSPYCLVWPAEELTVIARLSTVRLPVAAYVALKPVDNVAGAGEKVMA